MGMPSQALANPESFAQAQAQFAMMQSDLQSEEVSKMTHSELERMLETQGRELLRLLLQEHLDTRSPGEATGPVRDAEGTERSPTRLHERTVGSVFGPVQLSRVGYGVEGSASLHPLDAELNLPPERYSHELRRRAAQEAAKGSFDEALACLEEYTGTRVPKRQLEELVARAAIDFDAFYDQRSVANDEAQGPFLILSFDGKGVVMRKRDLREATRKAAEKRQHKLKRRLSKGEKRNAKRMATVATVYTIAPFIRSPEQVARALAPIHEVEKVKRPRPQSKRVWASLEKTPEQVIAQAFEEAHKRDPRHEKTWFVLVDGNPAQLKIIPRLAKKCGVDLTVVLDLIHVTEYLWKASTVFHDEDRREREEWVSQRLLEILRGHSSRVAGGIRRSATLRGLELKDREAADDCCDYLVDHASYLRYDQYLAVGAPIATGVIEGACRHLVKDRMELTGARWSLAGAEAVLRLRALRSSGDFDEYWRFHEAQEYQRNHAAQYANHEVPITGNARSQERKPQLKLVK
jgi:hypothetical protein